MQGPRLPPAFFHKPLAHRALHNRAEGRIENSRAAVLAAVDAGYGIEIDLQLSADGQAMVFHDDDLDRLTFATGPIRAQTAAALGQVVLKDSSETIPTLSQILTLVAGQVPLLIEVKDQSLHLSETDGRLEKACLMALDGYPGPVALMSFNPHAVAWLANLAPHLPRGLTTDAFDPDEWGLPAATCDRLRSIPDYTNVGASFLSHHWRDLARPRVTDLAAAGADILCWTIRSAKDERIARRVAQNITFESYTA